MNERTVTLNAEALDDLLKEALLALKDGATLDEVGPLYAPAAPHILVTRLKSLRQELAGPARPKSRKRYQMFLESVGNPDFGQYAPVSDPLWVEGDSLEEMREHAGRYRSENELGGGNWANPTVLRGDKVEAHFSYNLRCWKGPFDAKNWQKAKEIKIKEAPRAR